MFPIMMPSTDSLKRKLRQLKKLEIGLRFRYRPVPEKPDRVWDSFFSTRGQARPAVRYPLPRLSQMSREEQKQVFEEYFYWVYFRYYQENGLTADNLHDPQLLALLGLPPYAGLADIKKRFRELAKRHHPDHGGDSDKFIELMQVYEKLTGQ
jgi:hypothetical protein